MFGAGISISAFSFCGSGCRACLDITSPKNGTDVHLKWHLSLLRLGFMCLHIVCSIGEVGLFEMWLAYLFRGICQ